MGFKPVEKNYKKEEVSQLETPEVKSNDEKLEDLSQEVSRPKEYQFTIDLSASEAGDLLMDLEKLSEFMGNHHDRKNETVGVGTASYTGVFEVLDALLDKVNDQEVFKGFVRKYMKTEDFHAVNNEAVEFVFAVLDRIEGDDAFFNEVVAGTDSDFLKRKATEKMGQ